MNKIFRMKHVLGAILVAVLLTTMVTPGNVEAAPIFTGIAATDFTSADAVYFPDPGGVGDVGVPLGAPPGVISGWDLVGIYFDYDASTDMMYVGIDCARICGDADGDGNPGGTSGWLATQGGNDVPNLGGTESFSLLLDGDNDFVPGTGCGVQGCPGFETIIGDSAFTNISSFGVYNFTGTPEIPSIGYGLAIPGHATTVFANPSTGAPDLEFSVANFSTLPRFSFSRGAAFTFQAYLYAGSLEDDGVGEDFLPTQLGAIRVDIPASASLGDFVWLDSNHDGIQNAGEAGISGVTANLYDSSDNLVATTTTDATGHYFFRLLDIGGYYVRFVPPPGYRISPKDTVTPGDSQDSDMDPTTYRTIITNLDAGEDDLTWDAGLYIPTERSLPKTGFAPGRVSSLPSQPKELSYSAFKQFSLEIPRLRVTMPIVGVPLANSGVWDVSWLGSQAGWLNGTAFPTWSGNSAITGHVYLPNGQPGPFVNLGTLKYGDQIIVNLLGYQYIYEVRTVSITNPDDVSSLRHEDLSWVTLITCKQFDEKTNSYKLRTVARAVLVKVRLSR